MKRPACAGLWDTPMVYVNGDVTTCCLDERLENRLGNVRETPLAALWQGEQLDRWRLAHAEGRFHDSGPYCPRCNWRSAGAMSEDRVEAWLAVAAAGTSPVAARARAALARRRSA